MTPILLKNKKLTSMRAGTGNGKGRKWATCERVAKNGDELKSEIDFARCEKALHVFYLCVYVVGPITRILSQEFL